MEPFPLPRCQASARTGAFFWRGKQFSLRSQFHFTGLRCGYAIAGFVQRAGLCGGAWSVANMEE
jgi:hypothetical protein